MHQISQMYRFGIQNCATTFCSSEADLENNSGFSFDKIGKNFQKKTFCQNFSETNMDYLTSVSWRNC